MHRFNFSCQVLQKTLLRKEKYIFLQWFLQVQWKFKKRESIMGTFVQHLDAVIVMGKTKVQELKEVIILSQCRTGKDCRRGWKRYLEISGHQPYIIRYVEISLLEVCMVIILKHSFCSTLRPINSVSLLRPINSVSLISCISNWFKPTNLYPTEFIISNKHCLIR